MTNNFTKIPTPARTSSMESTSISQNKDGSIQLNIFNDLSHGDRTFSLAPKDALNIINQIASLLEKE